MTETLQQKIRFDGGCLEKAKAMGFEGVPNQYVKECSMGAINLHIYQMGSYAGCSGCQKQKACKEYAGVAGEQAEI